jgi:hypothetical protein
MPLVLGYGSLLNLESLRRTCPGARHQAPCRIAGWRRHGHLPSGKRDPDHGPYAVTDVVRDGASTCNAVLIELDGPDLEAMRHREHRYRLVEVGVAGLDGSPLGRAGLWVSGMERMSPDWSHPKQSEYYATCLAGAASFGEAFLREFIATTDLDGRPIGDHPRFADLSRRAGIQAPSRS